MFGVSNFFLKDINTFIQQGWIVLIKRDSEDIYNFSISNKLCFLTFYSKNPKKKKSLKNEFKNEKINHGFHKILHWQKCF